MANTRGASYSYAGKGLQTLTAKEIARLDKGLMPRIGNHEAFCLTRGLDPKGNFTWTWVADVAATLDEDGYKLPVMDEYMLSEAYSPVRLRHPQSGVECIVGAWTAEHCFGVLDIAEARQRRLHEDAVAVHGKLLAGEAGYEKSPDSAFEGVDGYTTETVAAYTGNAEDEPKAGAAAVKAWRTRFARTTRDAILAQRKAALAAVTGKTPAERNAARAALEQAFIAEDEANKRLR